MRYFSIEVEKVLLRVGGGGGGGNIFSHILHNKPFLVNFLQIPSFMGERERE